MCKRWLSGGEIELFVRYASFGKRGPNTIWATVVADAGGSGDSGTSVDHGVVGFAKNVGDANCDFGRGSFCFFMLFFNSTTESYYPMMI